MMQTLSNLPSGACGVIQRFQGGRDFAARAVAMGFTIGAEVTVIQNYGHGPVLIGVRGTRIALGRGEAAKIQVSSE